MLVPPLGKYPEGVKRLALVALLLAGPARAEIPYRPQPVSQVGSVYSGNLTRGILAEMDRFLRQVSLSLYGAGVTLTGAPDNASYVVMGANAALTSERTLTATAPVTLTDGGANANATIALTRSALTKNDETNITLTLNGNPSTALVDSCRIVPGWQGDLAFSRLTQIGARSVLGVTGNSTADVAGIQGTTNQVLRVDSLGTGLSFGTTRVAGGGTGITAGTSGGIPYFASSSAMASSAVLTANGVVYGGGAAASPASTAAGTTSQVLIGGTPPSFGAVPAAALDVDLQEIAAVNNVRGDLLVTDATPSWVRLATGTANQFMRTNGTDPAWATSRAMTANNETNIGITLNGTPSTSLMDSVRIVPTWSGTLAVSRGGTGSGTATGGFNALSPLTTRGDLLTRDGTNNIRLGIAAAGYAFTTDGTDPSWDQTPEWTGDHTWIDCRPIIKGSASGPLALQWWNTASGANGTLDLQASPPSSGAITVEIPNAPGQVTITGSGSTPPTSTTRIGKVNITGKTDTIAVTNLTNITGSSIATGFYMVNAYLACTTAEAASGPLNLHLTYTDDAGAHNAVSTLTLITTATGSNQVSKVFYISSGNISYGVRGYTNPAGGVTPAYAVRIRVTFLGT